MFGRDVTRRDHDDSGLRDQMGAGHPSDLLGVNTPNVRFFYDDLGRRIWRALPGGRLEVASTDRYRRRP